MINVFYNDYMACHGLVSICQWVTCIGIEDMAFKTCLVGLGEAAGISFIPVQQISEFIFEQPLLADSFPTWVRHTFVR